MKVRSSWNKIKSFIKVMKMSYPHFLIILFSGGLMKAAIPFFALYFSAAILNQLISGLFDKVVYTVAFLLGSQFIAGLIAKLCDQRMHVLEDNSDRAVKQMLSSKAFELEYEKFEMQETRDALRRADLSARGVGGAGEQVIVLYRLAEYAFDIVFSIIFTVILFVQVDNKNSNFFTSYWSSIMLIMIYVLMIFICNSTNKKVVGIWNDMNKKNDRVNSMMSYIGSIIMSQKNAKDIRIFKLQKTLLNEAEELDKKGLPIYINTSKKAAKYYAFNAFLSKIVSGIAYVFIGAKALYGVIPIGNVLLYAGAVNKAAESLMQFMPELSDFLYRADILDTFTEFINMKSMSYDGTLPIEKRDDGRYIFEFHDVSFSYPGTDMKVLSHINLRFNIGQKLAVVGRNGAGKTTLVKLLCRLYEPTDGYITLNDIDIRKYSYKEYVQAFSVVFQDFAMFSMPLDENVAGSENVDKERLDNALEQVALKERVYKMKDGPHSQLYHDNGEGIDISGGEAQRLAIARALYKDAPFVILDEPTAALDPIAESEIYENFNKVIKNKTALYISHRMSSCKFCDDIVVLDKGKITEYGTHDELIKQNGIYAELYNTQAQYYK